MKHIVRFTRSMQRTEDHWEMVPASLEVNETTTIGEIHKWYKQITGNQLKPMENVIIESMHTKDDVK